MLKQATILVSQSVSKSVSQSRIALPFSVVNTYFMCLIGALRSHYCGRDAPFCIPEKMKIQGGESYRRKSCSA